MSTAISATLSPESLPPLVYKDQPVITTDTLAALYGTESARIHDNFYKNKARFVYGKHCFKVEGEELRGFKDYLSKSEVVKISRNVRHMVLWTARGAARHAKMLDTDKAWEVFELLEDSYFSTKAKAAPALSDVITADRHLFLTRLLQSKVNAFPEPLRAKLYAQAWTRFKNKFRIAKIEQLPIARFEDAVEYLTMQVLKLPNTVRADAPALPAPAQEEADHAEALKAHQRAWIPELNEIQQAVWRGQGEVLRVARKVYKLAHSTDGNDVRLIDNMAQAASHMVEQRAEAIKANIEELFELAQLAFSAIACNLELKVNRKALREVRRALPA